MGGRGFGFRCQDYICDTGSIRENERSSERVGVLYFASADAQAREVPTPAGVPTVSLTLKLSDADIAVLKADEDRARDASRQQHFAKSVVLTPY